MAGAEKTGRGEGGGEKLGRGGQNMRKRGHETGTWDAQRGGGSGARADNDKTRERNWRGEWNGMGSIAVRY
eukprot:3147068-Pyramimonas_sp.AAC.1